MQSVQGLRFPQQLLEQDDVLGMRQGQGWQALDRPTASAKPQQETSSARRRGALA